MQWYKRILQTYQDSFCKRQRPAWRRRRGCALILVLAGGQSSVLLPAATAADAEKQWGNDGNVGVLHVRGALTESACRLDMTSAWQDISLGEVGTGRFQHIGARGTPVTVTFKLLDCLSSGSRNVDERTATRKWSAEQPSATVYFVAPADDDNPQLVQVSGAEGVGLRLLDSTGREVVLGQRGTPLLLTPGQDQLFYQIMLERTRAALSAGAFWSQINFKLNYD